MHAGSLLFNLLLFVSLSRLLCFSLLMIFALIIKLACQEARGSGPQEESDMAIYYAKLDLNLIS